MIIEFCDKTGSTLIAQRMWDQAPRRGDIVCLDGIKEPQSVCWVSWIDKDASRMDPVVRVAMENVKNKGAHIGKKS